MNIQFAIVGLSCLVSGAATASYELGLAHVNGTGIVRFDAITGAYLGAIPDSQPYYAGMALDSSNPGTVLTAFATGAIQGIKRFNYSTGELIDTQYVSSSFQPTSMSSLGNGNVLLAGVLNGFGVVQNRTSSMSLVRTLTMPAGTTAVLDAVETAAGNIIVLTKRTGSALNTHRFDLQYFTSSGVAPVNTQFLVDNQTSDFYYGLDLLGSSLVVGGSYGTNSSVYTVSGFTGIFVTNTVGNIVRTGGVAWGHGGRLIGLGYNGNTTNLTKTDVGTAWWDSKILSGFPAGVVSDIDVVVAPEPATWLLMAAGLCMPAMYRRRRAGK